MKFNLVWVNELPELSKDENSCLSKEIFYIENITDSPASMIYHHIFLTDDMDGPTVLAYGKNDNHDDIFLEYFEKPVWVSLEDFSVE